MSGKTPKQLNDELIPLKERLVSEKFKGGHLKQIEDALRTLIDLYISDVEEREKVKP